MSHYDELSCLLFLDGQMEAGQALELASHVEHCRHCHGLLTALEREARLLSVTLKDLVEQPSPVAAPARLRPAVPLATWFAVLSLTVSGGFAFWVWVAAGWLQPISGAGWNLRQLLGLAFFEGVFISSWAVWGEMLRTFATGALMAVALPLFWRRYRRAPRIRGWGAAALLLAGLLAPRPAAAAELHKSELYTVPAGATLNNDLYVWARTAIVNGEVKGDVVAFAQNLTINGTVDGDVIAFSQTFRLNGTVTGSLRLFTQGSAIDGTVQHGITAFTNHIEIGRAGRVLRGVTVSTAQLALEGAVGGDLLGMIADTAITGTVHGTTLLRGASLSVAPGAVLSGPVYFHGKKPPEIAPGTALAGTHYLPPPPYASAWATRHFYCVQGLEWGAAFLVGLGLLLLLPGTVNRVIAEGASPMTLLFGLVTLAAVPVLAILAAVTVVGLGVSLIGLAFYVMGIYLAHVYAGLWIGTRLLRQRLRSPRAWWASLALGLLLVQIVTNVPYLGTLLCFLIILWGLGAQASALWHGVRRNAVAEA